MSFPKIQHAKDCHPDMWVISAAQLNEFALEMADLHNKGVMMSMHEAIQGESFWRELAKLTEEPVLQTGTLHSHPPMKPFGS